MATQVLEIQELSTKKKGLGSRLVVDGGDPIVAGGYVMHSRWPRIEPDDLEGLMSIMRAGLLTEMSGRNLVHQFETEISMWLGTNYTLTTSSGTAALHCALNGLNVQSGDEVIVPALTYVACAAAVIHQQAIPIFADVDPETYNLKAEAVEAAISERTKAIMVVHLHGLPAPMDQLLEIGRRHGIPILEDFSQAVGANYHGRMVGSMGAAGAASLMAGKNLPSAGEGGVMVTNELATRNRAAELKCFSETIEGDGSYQTLHETLGYNYRINIVSLAFASQQLFRIDEYNDRRIASAAKLDATLRKIPGFSPPPVPDGMRHVYHMYRFRFDPALTDLNVTTDQAHEALKQIFWNEGLPLVEFQNVPLPGHALMQQKVGYGRGCPWSCHQRNDVVYRIEDYPGALDAIRHSLVIGYPAQGTLANDTAVDHYIRCFRKVRENWRAFERFASGLRSNPPWAQAARLF